MPVCGLLVIGGFRIVLPYSGAFLVLCWDQVLITSLYCFRVWFFVSCFLVLIVSAFLYSINYKLHYYSR